MKNIHWVYFLHSVKSLAGAFVGVFIPIYFLKLGFSLGSIFVFWLVYAISLLIFDFVAAFLSKKIGFKPIIVTSMLFEFVVLYLLYILKTFATPLPILAIISGLQAAFYWLPINYLFATHSNQTEMGGDTSKFFALPKILSLPVPIISSVVIVVLGFNYLFIISGLIYLVSLYPLFHLQIKELEFTFNLSRYLELIKKYPRYFWAEFLENIRQEFEAIILPIVIFLTVKNIISVGVVNTLTPIGGILFTFFVGKLTDINDKQKLMRIGAFVMILCWLGRLIFPNAITFYIIAIIVGFVEALVLIPFSSIIYTNVKKENPMEFLLFREFSVGLARVFVYTIAIILSGSLITTLMLPVISVGLFMLY
jgi:MFS family permease